MVPFSKKGTKTVPQKVLFEGRPNSAQTGLVPLIFFLSVYFCTVQEIFAAILKWKPILNKSIRWEIVDVFLGSDMKFMYSIILYAQQ